jgi:hypothetical protein
MGTKNDKEGHMGKHTAEPWIVTDEGDERICIEAHHEPRDRGDGESAIHTVITEMIYADFEHDHALADAERLVACVNALRGLNPEGVRGLVEAAENIITVLGPHEHQMSDWSDSAWGKLAAALAAVKGERWSTG